MCIRAEPKRTVHQHRMTAYMNHSNIIMYTTEDGLTKIETTFEEDTVWLSIDQMAELFQRNKSTISRHISKIYEEGELSPTGTVAKFATVQMEGNRSVERNIEYYNLDVIISNIIHIFYLTTTNASL